MNHFHHLEGEQAIIRSGGMFKQVDVYRRGTAHELFVKVGSGYYRLLDNHQTSHPKTFWDELSLETKIGQHGHLLRG